MKITIIARERERCGITSDLDKTPPVLYYLQTRRSAMSPSATRVLQADRRWG